MTKTDWGKPKEDGCIHEELIDSINGDKYIKSGEAIHILTHAREKRELFPMSGATKQMLGEDND